MAKECENCGNVVLDNRQIMDSHEAWGRVLCMQCQIKANEGELNETIPTDKENELIDKLDYKEDFVDLETIEPEEITTLPTTITKYSNDIVRPAISAIAAKQAWQEYINMRNVILEQSDFQKIQGKDFIKKSGWRKFATFYNLTDKITEETRINDNGGFIWKIKVICTAPNGRQTEGVAMCASKEKSGPRIEHDVYSTAHTRAKNRAISDMIAAGEVSAEEMVH